MFGIITLPHSALRGLVLVRLLRVGTSTGARTTPWDALGSKSRWKATPVGTAAEGDCSLSCLLPPISSVPKLKKTIRWEQAGSRLLGPRHCFLLCTGTSCQMSPRGSRCHHTAVRVRTVRDLPKVAASEGSPQVSGHRPGAQLRPLPCSRG